MASNPNAKKTIKLRQADEQGREFIRVSGKNKTDWASCNLLKPGAPILEPGTPAKNKYLKPSPNVSTAQGFASGIFDYGIYAVPFLALAPLVTGTAAALSAPAGAIYVLAPFQLASTATATAGATVTEISKAAALLLGINIAGVFLSKDIKQPEFTNFNKPCNSDPGQGKF